MTSNLLENVQIYLLSHDVTRYCIIYFGNSSKIGIFLIHRLLLYLAEKKKKKSGVTELILFQEGQI